MLHITKETFPETKEITLRGVRWKQDAYIDIETDCSGDALDVTFALYKNRGGRTLLGRIRLDGCVPEEHLPEAVISSDFMRWWRQENGPELLYEALTSIILAKTARITFAYDSRSEGVLVKAQWGEFETGALLERTDAQKYFIR